MPHRVRSQELDDESAFPPLDDADNLGLVTRAEPRRSDEVSLDPDLLDELIDEYEGEPFTWADMTWRERAGVVLVLALVGLVYVAIIRALRG